MANETNIADHSRTIWTEPARATVAMALGKELLSYRVAAIAEQRGWTYFVASECGAIKIGRARNVGGRISDLQCANPRPLKLLAVVPDGSQEAEYHRRFAEHRIQGEWFEPHPDILAEIDHLASSEGE
ncbi:MAG: hypothetical protein Unbinned273contig1001_38 [Prokaryotic dsDNA virus sp.]|nr:MAG: hypothetical protein Unbinned273contig1001_38 [Prokaryotic dsDNA virus sp.]|tara:strand:- start:79 stop:462 length:384 start_codon:yes stop_codon:yes gene_type:complete